MKFMYFIISSYIYIYICIHTYIKMHFEGFYNNNRSSCPQDITASVNSPLIFSFSLCFFAENIVVSQVVFVAY